MNYLLSVVIGYLLGIINPAYILGKIKGVDIRQHGSNNAGASNAKILFGWGAGVLIAFIDILKSFLAFYLCKKLFVEDIYAYLGSFGTIMGHIFPFYLGFKAGKGYASYIGMLLAIDYRLALVMMLWCIVVTYTSNYIVLSTISTVIIVPIYLYLKGVELNIILVLIVIAIVMIYKHRINIVRIINHEEIGFRKK